MRLPFKISGIIVGKEKINQNIQIDSALVCTGEALDKEKIGGILKIYLEKSFDDARNLIDITAVHDKSFYTWKSFDKLTDPKTNLAMPVEKTFEQRAQDEDKRFYNDTNYDMKDRIRVAKNSAKE